MKNITKATVTLALGIGLLVGTAGIASASPHYSDYKGGTSFKAPVSSYTEVEWTLKAPVSPNNRDEWTIKAPVASVDQNLQPNILTEGGTTCPAYSLRNIKDVASLEHGPGLHDSVHCLHNNGAFEASNGANNFFSRGLHNNGAFLPWHRG